MSFFNFLQVLIDEVKSTSWKNEAKCQKLFKLKFHHKNLLRKSFESTLSSNPNALSVWKANFLLFCKFLSDEVETIFWESDAKRSKRFKSKFGSMKLLTKWFWSNLQLKNECSEYLKRTFFLFFFFFCFANIWVTKLKPFSGEVRQSIQDYLNQNLVIGSFLENGFEATCSLKMNVLSV